MADRTEKFAILIDAENISSRYIQTIMDKTAKHGDAIIRRIYGNWTTPELSPWKDVLNRHSIKPIQQYSNTAGKNSSDCVLIIDAMDILYEHNVDGFVLASSDSDFTGLAMRLRESGKSVIGMCEHKTPSSFMNACTEIVYLDTTDQTITQTVMKEHRHSDTKKNKGNPDVRYRQTIDLVIDEKSDKEGWVELSKIGNTLKKRHPEFNVKKHGFKRLVDYMRHLGYEIEEESNINDRQSTTNVIVYIRKKTKKK